MQDLNDKATEGTLTAVEWNEVPSEIQNAIEDFGQSLSSGDLDQLGKSMSAYAATGTFYTGSGTANAHICTPLNQGGVIQSPPAYFTGMIARFRPSVANTAVATVNVNGLGIKTIKKENGTDLSPGDLDTTRDAWIRYDGTNFLLSNWASNEGNPGEFTGHFVRTSGSIYTLYPGIGGEIVINVDGARLVRTTTLTFDFGDLDTGAEAASTPYYFYIDNVAGVMTAVVSITPPTVLGAIGKVGYHPSRTDERCVLGVWNDVGSDFVDAIHMPDGKVIFIDHDSDHEHNLLESASTSWRNEPVNIPETAASVLFSAGAVFTSGDGMVAWGKDGASSTLSGAANDPTADPDIMFFAVTGGTTRTIYQIQDEMPIVDRTAPALNYGITNILEDHYMIVNGYRDLFAPKL